MSLFWRQGYEATSIDELVTVSGLNRGSMYSAFGDKRGLFMAVLDHYVANVSAHKVALVKSSTSAIGGITSFFEAIITAAAGPERNLGCLITNTLTEIAPLDPAISVRLQASLTTVEATFEAAIRRGQHDGEIAAEKNPSALARFLVGTAHGIRVLARSGAPEATLRDIAAVAISTLR